MDDNEFFGSDEIIINVADDLCNALKYKDLEEHHIRQAHLSNHLIVMRRYSTEEMKL